MSLNLLKFKKYSSINHIIVEILIRKASGVAVAGTKCIFLSRTANKISSFPKVKKDIVQYKYCTQRN